MAIRTARFPDRKISETILDFARLTPHALPSEAPERRARDALTVACTVWNAVVFADVLNDSRHLDEVRRRIARTPGAAALVEQLIARKRALYSDDERLIGNFEVTRARRTALTSTLRHETRIRCRGIVDDLAPAGQLAIHTPHVVAGARKVLGPAGKPFDQPTNQLRGTSQNRTLPRFAARDHASRAFASKSRSSMRICFIGCCHRASVAPRPEPVPLD